MVRREVNDKIEGDVDVPAGDHLLVSEQGMVTGTIRVRGGHFSLRGMCLGDVVVDAGDAFIGGMVSGSVINNGGLVAIHGVVSGNVITYARETAIDPKAVIRGATEDRR